MSKVKVGAFSVSIDGFGAGPRQDLQNPLGVRGTELHNWFFHAEIFKKVHGQSGGTTGIDNDFAAQSFESVGAWILGRNMFGPVRGPWKDDSWKGGGATILRTIRPCLCSLITRGLLSR
jgi:dihydrofolate reductase